MGCGGGYGGADYSEAGFHWVAGSTAEFDTYEAAKGYREDVNVVMGARSGEPSSSEATKEDVMADVLADAIAGYK